MCTWTCEFVCGQDGTYSQNEVGARDLLGFQLRWCGAVWFALIWFGLGWLGSILYGQIWRGLVGFD